MKNQAFVTLVVAYISVRWGGGGGGGRGGGGGWGWGYYPPPPPLIKASIEVKKTFLYH
jgi:hypothetical protein